jgi:hypothetical protein
MKLEKMEKMEASKSIVICGLRVDLSIIQS